MDNDLIPEKNWWKRNLKWFITVSIFLILCGVFLSFIFQGNLTEIVQSYSDNSLYEKAIDKAKTNQRVLDVIGEIAPVDKLAILECNAIYSNNNNSVKTSIRINGSKGKGKMDIAADKKEGEWIYKKINIRIKEPKEEIQVLKDSIDVNKIDAAQKTKDYKPVKKSNFNNSKFSKFLDL